MYWFITLFENFLFHWKSGSSNLLVERIYSIVALRAFVLASVSNELLPRRKWITAKIFSKGKLHVAIFFWLFLYFNLALQ